MTTYKKNNISTPVAKKFLIQFILFSDIMTGNDMWIRDLRGKNIEFITILQKYGNVIMLAPNYVNFMRYLKNKHRDDPNSVFAPKTGDINFKIADLQFENYASWAFNQIDKNIDYIAIAVDQGAHFAKYFVNKYPEKCKTLFVLTDRVFTKENYEKTFESKNNYDFIRSIIGDEYIKYLPSNVTDSQIESLLDRIKNNPDPDKYIHLLNGIVKGIIRRQFFKILYMRVDTIFYSDVNTLTPEKLQLNNKFSKESNGNVIYYYVDQDSGYLIHGKHKNTILNQIIGTVVA
jgi:hypothetical protein